MIESSPLPAVREAGTLRGLSRFLYSQNPFYLVSAALVLSGAPLVFPPGDDAARLLALLAGYTSVLAAACVLMIRRGGVWEDARSILLVVVLLCVATSACFDVDAIARPAAGALLLGAGWLFSAAVSEALLRGAGIRLALGFRLPYHALLGLFFGWPVALSALRRLAGADAVAWGILAFPVAAALLGLALVPAVRRGPSYVAWNGTPWKWPLFPWSLFVVLGAGVALRTRWLVEGYLPLRGDETPWGLFFLAPLVLAAGALFLESGLATGSSRAVRAGLWMPVAALLCALHEGEAGSGHRALLGGLEALLGGPALAVAGAAALFYAVALARGVREAEGGLLSSLGAAALFAPAGAPALRIVPLDLLAVAAAVGAVRERTTWRALVVGAALLASLGAGGAVGPLAGAPLAAAHGAYLVALGAALLLDDGLARALRGACAYALALAVGAALAGAPPLAISGRVPYAAAALALGGAVYLWTRDPRWFRVGLAGLGAALLWATGAAHGLSRASGGRGGAMLFWGGATFALGATVSAAKAGALGPALRWIARSAAIEPPSLKPQA